jgi:regulator of RNase E activity RraB
MATVDDEVSTSREGVKTAVCAERAEPLTDQDVERFLGEVVSLIESHGGHYDGWGAHTAD